MLLAGEGELLVRKGSCSLKRVLLVGDGELLVREGDCWLWEGLLIGGEGSKLVKGTIGR